MDTSVDMEGKKLAEGCYLIDEKMHEQLNTSPFNPAKDGTASEDKFSQDFASEISAVMTKVSDYFNTTGEFGNLERYSKGLPSDWWMDDDFDSTSRVLFVDLLNPELQTHQVLRGLQTELLELENDWMILVGHNNSFDAKGEYVEEAGEYYFWVDSKKIRVYSDRDEDIQVFMNSIREKQRSDNR